MLGVAIVNNATSVWYYKACGNSKIKLQYNYKTFELN